jgi:PAS domain-containing protein
MARALEITERGVAAQVSRLLERFGVPNRAGLIARVLSDTVQRTVTLSLDRAPTLPLSAVLENELDGYQDSKLGIAMTAGADNTTIFANDACRRIFGVGPEDPASPVFAARRESPGTSGWREVAARSFRTARPAAVDLETRWLNDDGQWQAGAVSCVIQPIVTLERTVIGLLWICGRGLAQDGLAPAPG